MKRSKRSSPGRSAAGGGEAAESGGEMNADVAYIILKTMEARDAMNWAIATPNASVRTVLNGDEIWRVWLRRDLGTYPVNPEMTSNAKATYLWYRFAIGICQSFIIRNVAPGGRLLYLNRVEPNLDFETVFRQRIIDGQPGPIFDFFQDFINPRDIGEELSLVYPQLIETVHDQYLDCIMGLIKSMEAGNDSNIRDYVDNELLPLFSKPPRIVEETHLIVASPLYMEEYAPILEKERLEMQEHARLIGAKSIHTFVNFNANDKEDAPAGVVTRHEPKSTVHPDAIPIDALQYLIMVPILGEHKDEEFDAAKLMEAIPQYAQRNPPAINDERSWNPELGSENSFAGVFKTNDGSRETKHFICVQASVPTTSKALRAFIAKNPKMTYEQLVNAPEYHSAHYVASRNAARIAYNVARALKVPIHHMEDSGRNAPQRAVPSFSQTSSTVRAIGSEVGVFSKVRPVESAGSQKFHAVYAGPYDGIALFHMDGKAKGIGLPVTTGYGERKSVNAPVSEKRAKGIVWEGNAKNHPDMHKDSFIAADADQFISAMRGTGWSETGIKSVTRFVPVAVKVFNPELKRMK